MKMTIMGTRKHLANNDDLQSGLHEEVQSAVSLESGKSDGVDNISAELVMTGGDDMIDLFKNICNRIWQTGEWPTTWTQSLAIAMTKRGNF